MMVNDQIVPANDSGLFRRGNAKKHSMEKAPFSKVVILTVLLIVITVDQLQKFGSRFGSGSRLSFAFFWVCLILRGTGVGCLDLTKGILWPSKN
jgi:hypothetical protein